MGTTKIVRECKYPGNKVRTRIIMKKKAGKAELTTVQ